MFVFQWFPPINTTLAFDSRDKCCRFWFYPLNDTYVDFVLGSTGVLLLLPSPLCAKLSVVVICAEFNSVLSSVVRVTLSAAALGAEFNSVLLSVVWVKLSAAALGAEFNSVLLSVVWVKLSAAALGAKLNSVLWPVVESQTQCCGSLDWT
jgi:hypothetical protein